MSEGVKESLEKYFSPSQFILDVQYQQVPARQSLVLLKFIDTMCIYQAFEAQVELTPGVTAAVFEDQQLTYYDLNIRSNNLAHYLRSLGVGPETCVGLYMERSVELIIGILGILKAGGAYVPLDPAYPKERLSFIMKDARLAVLLTQEHLSAGLREHDMTTICLDSAWPYLFSWKNCNPPGEAEAENLAYVIYTSGSTGKPKGVGCSHRNVLNLLADFQQRQPLAAEDGGSLWTSPNFDVSIYELFSALLVGGTLHIVPEEIRLEGASFFLWLSSQQIRSAYIPPFMLADFHDWLQKNDAFCVLKRLLVGVEPIPEQLLLDIQALLPNLHIINGYGPTETTICATLYSVTPQTVEKRNTPIGHPVQNTQAYVLDQNMYPSPVGTSGELYIGGEGVARGYIHNPELTAERFLPNPFSTIPGARLYKTGDLARHMLDSNIEFLGRRDHQIKLRGFRIELGEIEMVLNHHPAVQNAVVEVREGLHGDKQLVAYVVTKDEVPSINYQLHTFLEDYLPNYMIPFVFVQLEAFPLTPNGKVDRQALPSPEYINIYVTPRNILEEKLANIWRTMLGVERVGIHDNFFELGGHSLLAVQLLAQLRQELQVEIPFRSIFDAPSIAEFAKIIEENASQKQVLQLPPIQRDLRKDNLPLSFSQERIWLLQQLEPANRSYHFQALLRFTGHLDIASLERSLNEIVRRHEMLRTTFIATHGNLIQVIHPLFCIHLPIIDLSSLPFAVSAAQEQQYIDEQLKQHFDLTTLPLIRWIVLRLREQEHILIHVEHHIIHDGWSFNIFLGELQHLYAAFSTRVPLILPELPIQFADFAIWQRQWMQGEVAESQLRYWKQKLAGSPSLLELPTDRPRPGVQTFQGASHRVELPLDLCETLRDFSNREGTTLFMTMFAVFATLLSRYSNQEDICIGSGVANRRLQEAEKLIGMIINTVVLRINMFSNLSFRELLRQIREVILEAQSNQDFPFDKLVEALQPERSLSYNPLFQVMFAFHDSPLPNLDFPELELQLTEGIGNGSAKFDLSLVVIPRAEQYIGQKAYNKSRGITMVWEYNTNLFDGDTILRIMKHYQNLLEVLASHPQTPVWDLQLMTKFERSQVLEQWNMTQTAYPRDQCVHDLFEAQVKRTPDTLAVVFENESLTYQELNQRANQLACHLRSLGIGPEIPVGIYLERSIMMIVGLLGILKAGGAYVPLDVTYPSERLAFMLNGIETPVLLTQERFRQHLPEHQAQTVYLDTGWKIIAVCSMENLNNEVKGENLIYVIYTSGSTGQPKGVCISHSAVNRLIFNNDYTKLGPLDCVAQASNCSFDAATFEIWGALLTGARLVIITKDVLLSPLNFAKYLLEQQINTLFLTTALFNQLASEIPGIFHSLRYLLFGGEAVDPKWVRAVLKHGPPQQLLHVYGPTESTTFASSYLVQGISEEVRTIPIGHPISNTQIYILDKLLQPVPISISGELYIGGEGIARGYLHCPELTAERFLPDPFSTVPGTRLYKSGDLARYAPDGNIEFLGRRDHQIKLRGFRIELGEIEMILNHHPAVQEAIVSTIQERVSEKCLVAYIVLHAGQKLTEDDLRCYLMEKLPDYMVPSAFFYLEALPLTSNGKVDRHALSVPEQSRLVRQKNYIVPRSTLELRLTTIFEEILAISPIGVTDDFFTLGGHSLLAVRLMARIQEQFGREIPLSVLFQGATIEHLATILDRQTNDQLWSPLVCIQPHGERPPFFWVHPGGGSVLRYLPLARHLGNNQPSYAIEESFFNKKWKPSISIKDMANRYIKEIRILQPQGPYFLGGHSMGGTIAFEIANILLQEGDRVALLALLDTLAPLPFNQTEDEDNTSLIAWYAEMLMHEFSKDNSTHLLPLLLAEEKLRQLCLDEQLDYLLNVAKKVNFVPPNTDTVMLHRLMQINIAHAQAVRSYTPQSIYPDKITLFRATERLSYQTAGSLDDPTLGWSDFTSQQVEVYEIPGSTHRTQIEEPYVQVLAEHLKHCLARALDNKIIP